MSIQLNAIHRAVALLNASGAKFAVEFDDQSFGNAKLAQPEPTKAKRTRVVRFSWLSVYESWLKAVKPGDLFRHEVATKDEANSLRGALSGQLSHYYGPGSYIVTAEHAKTGSGWVVEALFVGRTTGAESPPATLQEQPA